MIKIAKLSTILRDMKGIPDKETKELATCLFCGNSITKGGCWAGMTYHIGVCYECSEFLTDLLIDTLEDTSDFANLEKDKRLEILNSICEKRFIKKEKNKEEMAKRNAERMEKTMKTILELKYYADMGIIDFFELTFTKEELVSRLSDNDCISDKTKNEIDEIEEKVKSIIESEQNEYPHTIRYFAVPDFDYCLFRVCVIAKIDNNGTTYMFAENSEIIKSLNIYDNRIKEM